MASFNLHIFAAEKVFYEGLCEYLVIPTVKGQYGILAHHSNMIAAVVAGEIMFRKAGKERGENEKEDKVIASVSAGLVKVEDNDVLVLVDSIERPEEIDENRARKAAAKAKEEMLQKRTVQEYRQAQAHLARAINRLKVKGRIKGVNGG